MLAIIGVVHCPSFPNLDDAYREFNLTCDGYTSALVKRCFAFCPGDRQLEDGRKDWEQLRLFPPADHQTQEIHLQTLMHDIAASLLMEFEKWVLEAESAGTILKTPLDSQTSLSSEEVIKAKKRRLGRAQKTIGDYCLLAASPIDANAHYFTALELSRLTADFFWYAGALEGSACALLLDKYYEMDVALEDEIKYRCHSVILYYRKSFIQDNTQRVSPLSFELEATLKLARFLCRNAMRRDVVDLLNNAVDGAKSLIDATDRLILYVEVARLFGTIGYQRKAAFFSRQVAQLYMQQGNRLAAISAMQVLLLTTETYRIQSKASFDNEAHAINEEAGSNHGDAGKTCHRSVDCLYKSQWNKIQMVVLRELLLSAVRARDPLTAWSAAARLIRFFYPIITPAGQTGLASSLANSAKLLPSGTRCPDPALPFIRLHSFPQKSSQMSITKHNSGREDWWAESAPNGPFIYTPFSKGSKPADNRNELTWVVGEPVQVLVELANPCGFDLKVDSIYLSAHSNNFDAFPIAAHLSPNASKVVSLSGIPTSVGPVQILGCMVHCFGVITEHLFRDVDDLLQGVARGLVLSDPFTCCGSSRLRTVAAPRVSVLPSLPLLVSRFASGNSSLVLHEGEIHDVGVILANVGTIAIEKMHVSPSGRHQESVISVPRETLKSALPLLPGAQVALRFTVKAWQLEHGVAAGSVDVEGKLKNDSSLSLLFYCAGNESCAKMGRRLSVPLQVRVKPGLTFVMARLLSMEIPAHVGRDVPKLVDDVETRPVLDGGTKMDGLVKIDPLRGSWGIRLLELELSNPTDVAFEVTVSIDSDEEDDSRHGSLKQKRRIERDNSARLLIPLQHFKLPILDYSFFTKNRHPAPGRGGANGSEEKKSVAGEYDNCELQSSIKNIVSKIKLRWNSGWNSCGEVSISEAVVAAALRYSIMDVLLPDPLTFGFRIVRSESTSMEVARARDFISMEVVVRNNTTEAIRISLSVTCRDAAGENCLEGSNPSASWAGVLGGIAMEVPPLCESNHFFALYFLVPGDYSLAAAAVIEDANDVLRARARSKSSDEPIFCSGPPYRLRVAGSLLP